MFSSHSYAGILLRHCKRAKKVDAHPVGLITVVRKMLTKYVNPCAECVSGTLIIIGWDNPATGSSLAE